MRGLARTTHRFARASARLIPALLIVAACQNDRNPAAPGDTSDAVPGASVTAKVTNTSLSMVAGTTRQLQASSRTMRFSVSWSSSAPAVASVNASGFVSASSAGQATITASSAGGTDRWAITVTPATTPPPPPPPTTGALGNNADLGRRLFPDDNPWNQPVDTAAVDPNSAAIIYNIGDTKAFHPDFGANWNGGPFGIPYVVVSGTQSRVPVSFDYADESDPGPYPIPANAPIEGGATSTGDRHVLVVDRDNWKLYELFSAYRQADGSWHAGSGAVFDLNSNALRPAGWTSADAAGLAILPGLVRYEEVAAGAINHAVRFTVSRTQRAYIPPARHWASSDVSALRPPMGMRVRLKAGFNISTYPPSAQVILRALKKYGMIVADNGSDWYVSGTADARWNDTELNTLKALHGSDFEVVKMTGVVKP